ncbi:MAG: hypothetical protein M1813_007204 [Trichoglossum hirsutum]|nr:MAG: hypothetical protein M1813_007204 [Trichoglossum hirsutum]
MVHHAYQKLSPKEAQELGQKYYRVRQYDLALEAFSAAIELSDKHSIGILDNRAATYEKLGDLKSALSDARHMLQLEKSNAQGYLRAGKILQLLSRKDDATSVYKRGLLKVPSTDPLYQVLRRIADKTPRGRDLEGLDPFLVLPIELAQMVAELLDFKSLVLCLRVSKHWNHCLSSLTPLWRDLDLLLAKRAVSERSIISYIRRSKGSITRALIGRLAASNTSLKPIISRIATRCKDLKHLEIRLDGPPMVGITGTIPIAQGLTTLILHCVLRLEVAGMLIALCPNLVHAEFHQVQCPPRNLALWPDGIERIRTLHLRHNHNSYVQLENTLHLVRIDPPKFLLVWINSSQLSLTLLKQPFLDLTPNLRELTLIRWDVAALVPFDYSGLSQLESLTLTSCGIDCFPLLPPTIRQLKIGDNLSLRMGTPTSQANLVANDLSQLESLTLSGINDLKLKDIVLILSHLLDCSSSPLKTLRISRCLGVTKADLMLLLTSNATKNVVELSLVGGNKIDDALVETISDMKHLEYLDLSENPTLTGVAVKRLISKSGTPLKLLRINQCTSVWFDAVEMARQNGIEVDFLVADWEMASRVRVSHFH